MSSSYAGNETDHSPLGVVKLDVFAHQVGGHSCLLSLDENTLCKPLNNREKHFYESMSSELKKFVPQYRGKCSKMGLLPKYFFVRLYVFSPKITIYFKISKY